MSAKTLGQRIQEARKDAGFQRQQDLADVVAGGRVATVNGWENDHAVPEFDNLVRLIHVLGVEPRWLLTGDGPMRAVDPGEEAHAFRAIARYVRRVTSTAKAPPGKALGLGRGDDSGGAEDDQRDVG